MFAGVGQDRDGNAVPTAYGRLCEWAQDPNHPADAFESFGGYQRTLTLDCQEGQPGILQWTPDANTPDLVYYQVSQVYRLYPGGQKSYHVSSSEAMPT